MLLFFSLRFPYSLAYSALAFFHWSHPMTNARLLLVDAPVALISSVACICLARWP
jgi:hypothetical protein